MLRAINWIWAEQTLSGHSQPRITVGGSFTTISLTGRPPAPSFDEGAGEVKIKVKGNGQGCPFDTGKGNVNVKNGAVGVRGSHPCAKNAQGWGNLRVCGNGNQEPHFSQRTREMGHPKHVIFIQFLCEPLLDRPNRYQGLGDRRVPAIANQNLSSRLKMADLMRKLSNREQIAIINRKNHITCFDTRTVRRSTCCHRRDRDSIVPNIRITFKECADGGSRRRF
jgi:hypothetical protein